MKNRPFSRDNHYVPRLYLKRWANPQNKVWVYRLLTSHQNVPEWQQKQINAIAYHHHLYTKAAAGGLTDEIEQWLSSQFETPAEDAIAKAVSNARLSPHDWRHLIRFLAAQDVRTPARLIEILQRLQKTLPKIFNETLAESVQKLEQSVLEGKNLLAESPIKNDPYDYPIKISTEIKPGDKFGKLKAETIVGRSFWLADIKLLLTKTIKSLLDQKWTILRCPNDFYWLTSDDPVIKLNYYEKDKYDFKGGWGSKGTEIFFPISPHHLIYTRIGEKPPNRGTIVSREMAEEFQKLTIEHAHRFLFSSTLNPEVAKIRPRMVNRDLFLNEIEQWREWHNNQTLAEKSLLKPNEIQK